MLQNVTGQVVEGDNFFDREGEIARFWRGLETDNLLLLAPRRVGKSSVLRRMKATAEVNGFAGVYVDVSDCSDEIRFVHRLYSAILEHHQAAERLWNGIKESWLGKTIGRVKKAGAAGFSIEFSGDEAKWARMGEELAEALAGLEGETLIQVDELPVFVLKLLNRKDDTDQGRIREFLYWLRRLRQDYPRVRWMLAGSIGLDTVASRLNIADSVNDLRIETLGAFDVPTSHALLQELAGAYDVALEDVVRDRILARVGWPVPYYLQLIFDKLRDCKKPGIADVDGRWTSCSIRSTKACSIIGGSVSATNWGGRATVADADTREDKVRYLLDVLENDGYLVEEGKRWRFRSPLLREYWLRRVAPPESADE